jgi:hypothetical protein
MARKVHWRHLTTQVAIMSLVFQAVMAALMLPTRPALAEGIASAEPAIVICTGTGFTLITFDENGNQVEKPLSGKPCPICDGIATSAFLLGMAPNALIGRLTNPEVLRPANELRPASIACLAHRSRGPPALV